MPDTANTYTADKKLMTEKYFDTVYRLAFARTKERSSADDVTQEVFLKFFKTDKAFESEEHIKAWLLKVTINSSKDIFLSSWAKKTVPLSEVKDEPVFDAREKSDLYYAILALPQKYKTALHLFYYEDYSVAEIAKLLGAKEATVKSQLHRGRAMLKEKLTKGGDELAEGRI